MKEPPKRSAAYFRIRAEEIRIIRDNTNGAEPRAMLHRIAQDYDRLARWADGRQHGEFRALMTVLAVDYGDFFDGVGNDG